MLYLSGSFRFISEVTFILNIPLPHLFTAITKLSATYTGFHEDSLFLTTRTRVVKSTACGPRAALQKAHGFFKISLKSDTNLLGFSSMRYLNEINN